MPRSLSGLALTIVACAASAAAGLLTASRVLSWVESLPLWCVAGAAIGGVAELVRRKTRWRWLALAFQVGVASTYLLAAFVILSSYASA